MKRLTDELLAELVELWNAAVRYEADNEAVALKIAQAFPALLAELRKS